MSVPIPKLSGVCGWPVHHSLSPVIHNYWLREMQIAGAYVQFAVRPDNAVQAFRDLKRTSIAGVNVTIPLKGLAYEAADIVTPDAEKLGVANCLYKKDGQLFAHNTDMQGFAAPLLNRLGAKAIMNLPVLVIGTGGAARAVLGALLSLNCPEIRICGRTDEKAIKLVQEFKLPSLYAVPWEQRHKSLPSAGIVVNASSAGMKGMPKLNLSLEEASPNTFIYDLVYTPRMTGLLRQAKAQKLPFIGGLEMLIAQARPSFKLFFGQDPDPGLDPTPLIKKELSGR